jgi:hypothetical protein
MRLNVSGSRPNSIRAGSACDRQRGTAWMHQKPRHWVLLLRFVDELLARVRRAGATGEILIRADSGFWNKKVMARLREKGCRYSIGVTQHKLVAERIAQIPDDAWRPVADYPDTGIRELAETALGSDRLIVRRVHLHAQDDQTELFTYWRHFAFITNRPEPLDVVDSEHRQHAQVELVIRDLKDQALAHFPSGDYSANSAWTVIACLAHNLARWTNLLGVGDTTPRAARTLRRDCSRCPAVSPAPPGAGRCTCPPAGPGNTTSSAPWRASQHSPQPPDGHRSRDDDPTPAPPTPGAFQRCPQTDRATPARPSHALRHRPPDRRTAPPARPRLHHAHHRPARKAKGGLRLRTRYLRLGKPTHRGLFGSTAWLEVR